MSRTVVRAAIEPAIAAVFFVAWFVSIAARWVTYVPLRTETFLTNPYAVAIAVGFALAVAFVRISPVASLSITAGLLTLQLLFWPARFSQVSWTAYLGLLLLAIGIGAYGGRIVRWIGLALSVVFAVTIAALLNLANLSLSGTWGAINGKPNSSVEVFQGFEVWGVVIAGLAVGAWFLGRRIRRPNPRATPAVSQADGDAITNLSPREREIFMFAAKGLSNAEIAREAHIGESTVKTHLGSISAKLGVSSRAQLVVFAYETQLLTPATATV
jgi:DNA-binding CsgD family transcriptional regulator